MRFLDTDQIFWVRMVGDAVMVRVGGGWELLETFLDRHGSPQSKIVVSLYKLALNPLYTVCMCMRFTFKLGMTLHTSYI